MHSTAARPSQDPHEGAWSAVRSGRLRPRQQGFLLTLPAIIALVFLIGFPILYTVWLSLHEWYGSRTLAMDWVGLANYADLILRDSNFHRSFLITVTFTFFTVTLSVMIGLGLALLLNSEFVGHGLVRTLLMIPIVSTPVAVSLTWKYILNYDGLLNSVTHILGLGKQAWLGTQLVIPSLIVVDVTRWVPLVMLIILAGLASLETEPFEAATVDGASSLQLIRYITLPLLRPHIGVAALLRLIDAIKTFDEVMVISEGGPAGASETLYLYGYKVAFSFMTFGYASALLIVLFLIVLVASMLVLRLRRAA